MAPESGESDKRDFPQSPPRGGCPPGACADAPQSAPGKRGGATRGAPPGGVPRVGAGRGEAPCPPRSTRPLPGGEDGKGGGGEVARHHRRRSWRRRAEIVYATQTHCAWCGQWVDQTLPPTHPMSRSADHIISVADGGDPDQPTLALMHRRCNTAKENLRRRRRRRGQAGSGGWSGELRRVF